MRFDPLDRNTIVWGSHFLEAAAGTGKTFTIEHVVVRLLIESENPLLIEQILVVTFTRAQTRELKSRIHRNIQTALEQLLWKKEGPDYLLAILEEDAAVIKQAIRRLEDALASFDLAQIFTIHGFCYRMLSQFAFESGAPLQLNDPDQTGYTAILDQIVEKFLLRQIEEEDFSPGQITRVLDHFNKEPARLKSRIFSLVHSNKQIAPLPRFKDSFQKALQVFKDVEGPRREELLSKWLEIRSFYKQMGSVRFTYQMELLSHILERKECSQKEWDLLLSEKELFLSYIKPENRKVRVKGTLPYCHALEHLERHLLPVIEEAREPVHTLLRLAKHCKQKIDSHRSSAESLFPDDLLEMMQKAVYKNSFAEKIRASFSAVIIDEFQDTDPIQFEIFQTLFIKEAIPNNSLLRTLYFVGDPKQSIYAFRNADLYTYFKAFECLGKQTKKYLDTNYRSSPSLVAALNALFTAEEVKGWMRLPSLNTHLDLFPVRAGLTDPSVKEAEEIGAVHFFAKESPISSAKFKADFFEEEGFFPYIVEQILKEGGNWEKFAILVKDRYQAARILSFLNRYGISARIHRNLPLNESEAFEGLQKLIEALSAPSDLSALKQLLSTQLIGWNYEMLKGGFELERFRKAKEEILILRKTLFERGFSPFFDLFLKSSLPIGATVEQRLSHEELYFDLKQLEELFIDLSWSQEKEEIDWPALFAQVKTTSLEEDKRLKSRACKSLSAVSILTMHMSKGLEFEIVFALGVAFPHPLPDEIAIEGEGMVPLQPEDPRCRLALSEMDAEKLRQLYVALTRAKQRVYIPLALHSAKKIPSPGEASPIELYFMAACLPQLDFEQIDLFLHKIGKGKSITFSRVPDLFSIQAAAIPSAKRGAPQKEQTLHLQPIISRPIVSYSFLAKQTEMPDIQKIALPEEGPPT
ncbi:MAG: UvrD-helicase domain-containing protein, partial [Chlamydiales bacterium]|nr:UvrD-helicase domain-containing protein [Chlamydiales bacterium]